jgi:WD40 repeat protein
VRRLQQALEARGKSVWVDVEGIRDAELFPVALLKAVESSDAFVFVISPDSVGSEFCVKEVDHAVALNKRIVPLALRPAPDEELPDAIRLRNWIPVDDGFDEGVARLLTAIETDLDWEHKHTRLTVKALEWDQSGRDRSFLLRGSELAAAEQWLAAGVDKDPGPSAIEHEYLLAARAARSRRQRLAVGASLAIAAVAVGLLIFALISRSRAIHAARVSLADSLGAQAISDPRLDQAMLLGVEALKLDSSEQTQGDLLTAVLRAPSVMRTLHGDGLRVNGMAVSPDGRIVALEDNVPNIFFLDAASGRRMGEVPSSRLPGGPSDLTFTRDRRLVLLGGPPTKPNQVDLIDVPSGTFARRLFLPRSVIAAIGPPQTFGPAPNIGANNFSLSHGGRRLAVAVAGYAVQWKLPQGQLAATPLPLADHASFVFYSPDARRLVATGDTRTFVLDAASGKLLRSYPIAGSTAALAPNGRTMVYGESDGSVRFLDLRSGAVTTSVAAHDGNVSAVGFTTDSQTAITSGEDGKSRVWNVATHQVTETLAGHAGGIPAQATSPDGTTLYTGGVDGSALAWDLTGKRGLGASFRAAISNPALGAWNVAISGDGRLVAVGGSDGTVNVWSTRSLRRVASFGSGSGLVAAVSFSPGGRSLLVANDSGTIGDRHGRLAIWALDPAPHVVRALKGTTGAVNWAVFNPAGSIAAAAYEQPAESPTGDVGIVAEWSARSGGLVAKPTVLRGGGVAVDLAFARHGTTVVVAEFKNRVAIVDPARTTLRASWKDSAAEFSDAAALSPSGKQVATADLDGYLHIWNAQTGKPELPPIRAAENALNSVNWSPDGSRVVTAGDDIRLYDANNGQEIGTPLPVPHAEQPYAVIAQDGSTIAVADDSGQVWLYPATAPGWEAYACRVANRNLTPAEWKKFVPGQPYQQICPGNSPP